MKSTDMSCFGFMLHVNHKFTLKMHRNQLKNVKSIVLSINKETEFLKYNFLPILIF